MMATNIPASISNQVTKNSPDRFIRLTFLILSLSILSFLLKYVSEWTHEFLGHCGFGWLAGGFPQSWYVSWIWPLEFGYANVTFPFGIGTTPRAIMMIGGIAACLIAALLSHSVVFLISRKKILPISSISTKKLIIFHILFWYGFWAFANSIGYLILGGLTNFGDIALFRIYTGAPSWIFIIIGFALFFLLFYLISFNASIIFHPLLPNTSSQKILTIFWLIIPLIFLLLFLNPDISVSTEIILASTGAMFLPSLIMVFLGNRFPKNITWKTFSQ